MTAYPPASADIVFKQNKFLVLILLPVMTGVLVWSSTRNLWWGGAIALADILLLLSGFAKHSASGYEIRADSVRITRPWPYRHIDIPIADIRRVRAEDMLLPDPANRVTRSYGFPNMRIKEAIPLLDRYEPEQVNPSSRSCVYLRSGLFGYQAFASPSSGIKVRSFATNAGELVVIEGPINHVISPKKPEAFVGELRIVLEKAAHDCNVGV